MPGPALASVRIAELSESGHRQTVRQRQVRTGPRPETRTPTRVALYSLAALVMGAH